MAVHHPIPSGLSLTPAGEGDFEALLALRMAAMRESLERAGHFDPQRVRERLSRGYLPAYTRHILKNGEPKESAPGFLNASCLRRMRSARRSRSQP